MGPEPRGSPYRPTPRSLSTGPKPARNATPFSHVPGNPTYWGPTFKIGRCHIPLGTNGKLATWGTHLPWLRLSGVAVFWGWPSAATPTFPLTVLRAALASKLVPLASEPHGRVPPPVSIRASVGGVGRVGEALLM